jgi:hypothetical protein
MSFFVQKLVAVAESEWEFFGRSRMGLDGTSVVGRKEYQDGAWQRIADYWQFIGGPYKNLSGRDRGTPWSAAFVSWCMNEAGAGKKFPYSAGHATYINQAVTNAQLTTKPIVARELDNYSIKPGDLIGYWRGDRPVTIQTALQLGWYESHMDIVVSVGLGVANCIGGNVLHSVTQREVRLDDQGRLIDTSSNWFVAIENRI